jgi:hypothetical protein
MKNEKKVNKKKNTYFKLPCCSHPLTCPFLSSLGYLPNVLTRLLPSLGIGFKRVVHMPFYNPVLEDFHLQPPFSLFRDSSQLSSITNLNLSSRIDSSTTVVAHVSGVLMTQLLGFKPLQLLTSLKVECCVPITIASMCHGASA